MRKIWCDKDTCRKKIEHGEQVITLFDLDFCEDCALTLKASVLAWTNPEAVKNSKPEYSESDCASCK